MSTAHQEQQQQEGRGWRGLVGMGLTGLAAAWYMRPDNEAKTCGIVGVVGADDARAILLEGLTVLQNRGYDSAGLATISQEKMLVVTKYASVGSTSDSIDLVKANSAKHRGHHIGIAHTRWEGGLVEQQGRGCWWSSSSSVGGGGGEERLAGTGRWGRRQGGGRRGGVEEKQRRPP